MKNLHFLLALGLALVGTSFAAVPLDTVIERIAGTDHLMMKFTVQKGTKIREGHYESYHPNGQVAHSGTYVNGKINGPWKSFFPSGQLWKELTYVNDQEEGLAREWDSHGVLLYEHNYKDGDYAGTQKTFTEDGSPETEETWAGGKLNGVVHLWEDKVDSGTPNPSSPKKERVLTRELWYKDGRLDGNLKVWWPNGNMKAEMAFQEGRPNGLIRNYDENGQLLQDGEYFKGAKNGKQHYYEKGKLVREEDWELDQCKKGCPVPKDSLATAKPLLKPASSMQSSSSANVPPSSAATTKATLPAPPKK